MLNPIEYTMSEDLSNTRLQNSCSMSSKIILLEDAPPKCHISALHQLISSDAGIKILTIAIDDAIFECHMIVLQCYTNFFNDYKGQSFMAISSAQVTPHAFGIIYKWMLDSEPQLPRAHLLEVFKAAEYFQIPTLIQHCWICFDNASHFIEAEAALLHAEAKKLGVGGLHKTLLNKISKFFLTYVASQDYVDLSIEEVCVLLNSNMIGVNTELEIVMAIIVWLSHDIIGRRIYVDELINCIRYYLLPILHLYCFGFGKPINLLMELLLTDKSKKLARECIEYLTDPIKRANHLKYMPQRRWIFDKNCPYHHQGPCTHPIELSYKTFKEYLHMLQSRCAENYWKNIEFKDLEYEHPLIKDVLYHAVRLKE